VATAPVARLHFVQDRAGAGRLAGGSYPFEESWGGYKNTAYALDPFYHDGRYVAPGEFPLHGGEVVERQKSDRKSGIDGRFDAVVVRDVDRRRGAAVERMAKDDHALAARRKARQFDGVFVGFGPAAAEEQLVIVAARELAQFVGQLLLQRVLYRVGVETQAGHLLLHHAHVVGVAVSDGNDGVPTVKIEVGAARLVVYVAALAPHGLQVEKRVNVVVVHKVAT